MCGITGFIDYTKNSSPYILERMVDTLNHRGPDDKGKAFYKLKDAQVGLGHTRLSIIDLSAAGHQPMKFNHWTIVFNGEVYNFKEIRQKLISLGHQFHSDSDTEVVLHAFVQWGKACINQFIGMFAFVIYDNQSQKVYVFRDRAGIKPLYYFQTDKVFLFASELKALHEHPEFKKDLDLRAVKVYFDLGYIPAPYCIFKNTHKLKPGHFLTIDLGSKQCNIEKYWNASTFFQKPKFKGSIEEVKEQLHELLISAFQYRMVSDVPVGIFLSGGYDSTAVAAILQKQNNQQLKTFTVGFEEGNNEAPYARETAEYIGTDHHEFTCTTEEALKIIPQLPYFFDEPFADSSAIPTCLVSKFAREQVTVALSADGGDELFAGYTRYAKLETHLRILSRIPGGLEKVVALGANWTGNILPLSSINRRHHLKSIAQVLEKGNNQRSGGLYKRMHLMPEYYHKELFHSKVPSYKTAFDNYIKLSEQKDQPLLADFQCYLPDDILAKVDRATMSVSLEGRDPLLDHRLLEFSAQLPYTYKRRDNYGKAIFKEIVHEYVPRSILDRPKAGFSIPLTNWLKNGLKKMVEETFNETSSLDNLGIRESFFHDRFNEFKKDQLHYKPLMWKMFMFKLWAEEWL